MNDTPQPPRLPFPEQVAMLALALRVGLLSLEEARARALVWLRDERFFQCIPATTQFEVPRGLKLPPSTMMLFGLYETVAALGTDLLLDRRFVRRSSRHRRLVQIGMNGFTTEVASHPFIDTVYEIEDGWLSPKRPVRCKSVWHYLLICAASADRVGVFESLETRRSWCSAAYTNLKGVLPGPK